MDLAKREAELLRLNEELDRRKDAVVKKADNSLRTQQRRMQELERAQLTTSISLAKYPGDRDFAEATGQQVEPAGEREKASAAPSTEAADVRAELDHMVTERAYSNEGDKENGNNKNVLTASIDSLGSAATPVPGGMGSDATVRYLKARMSVLQEELQQSHDAKRVVDEQVSQAREKITAQGEDISRLQRAIQKAEADSAKQKAIAQESRREQASLERQLGALRKELDSSRRGEKQKENEGNTREVRLNRALEEAEKYKQVIRELRATSKDETEGYRRAADRANAEIKRLERQKVELLNAFKKQLKLIDVLKRQKIHIEAAKMLSFTEAEFSKTLDMGVN